MLSVGKHVIHFIPGLFPLLILWFSAIMVFRLTGDQDL